MNILSNKSVKKSDYYSRYNGLAYYYNKRDDKYQLQTKAWLKDSDKYVTYIVKERDTYDSIALAQYGNPTYYWIICDFNRIINPFIEPKEGDVLYLPILGSNLQ